MSAEKKIAFGRTKSQPVPGENKKIASTPILSAQGNIFIETKRNLKRPWKQRLLFKKTLYTVVIVDSDKRQPDSDGEQTSPYTTQVEARTMREATIKGFHEIARTRKKTKNPVQRTGTLPKLVQA